MATGKKAYICFCLFKIWLIVMTEASLVLQLCSTTATTTTTSATLYATRTISLWSLLWLSWIRATNMRGYNKSTCYKTLLKRLNWFASISDPEAFDIFTAALTLLSTLLLSQPLLMLLPYLLMMW